MKIVRNLIFQNMLQKASVLITTIISTIVMNTKENTAVKHDFELPSTSSGENYVPCKTLKRNTLAKHRCILMK